MIDRKMLLITILILIACLAMPYFIAISDLPDWFKFWLLS